MLGALGALLDKMIKKSVHAWIDVIFLRYNWCHQSIFALSWLSGSFKTVIYICNLQGFPILWYKCCSSLS